jgi:NDP-sugar pyrophosphorylase family protein
MLPVAILMGGLGTRVRPLTETVPKALLPIGEEPFVAHQLRLLQARGITRAVLCVGHLGQQIRDYVGDGSAFGMEIRYSWDGPVALGTAGALRRAIPELGDAFFVIYGDSYLPCDYRAVENAFRASGKLALMTVFHNAGQWDSSNVEFDGGRIAAYDKLHRTARMRHIDYGLGVFKSSAFSALPDEPRDLAAVYRDLLLEDQLAAFEVAERFYEAGSFDGIRALTEFLAKITDSKSEAR